MRFFAILVFIAMSLGQSLAISQTSANLKAVPNEYIVKYKASSLSISSQKSKLAFKAVVKKSYNEMGMYHISMKNVQDQTAEIKNLKNDPDVEFVEPNYIWYKNADANVDTNAVLTPDQLAQGNVSISSYSYTDLITNGEAYSDQGYYQNSLDTGVVRSWPSVSGLSNKPKVVVAVIDTGLDPSSILFSPLASGGANALWLNSAEANGRPGVDDDQDGYVDDVSGWNFINNTPQYLDDDSHGTHVAGIIVGVAQNIFARPLQESKIQVMPLKFLGADGSGTTSGAVNAIYYAVNHGAQVINNSWGGPNYSRALHEALTYAYNHSVLLVSAAGNYHSNNDTVPIYPANYDVPSNIAVASASNWDSLSGFSNYGKTTVHIASPGEYILSTVLHDRYAYMSGTSMAAPFISGMAALAWRENLALTGYQMREFLINNVDTGSSYQPVLSTGGRINSEKLISATQASLGSTTTYQPQYQAELRAPANDGTTTSTSSPSIGGCGLVSSISAGGSNFGGPNPMGPIVVSLVMLLPLLLVISLRNKSEQDEKPWERRVQTRVRMNSAITIRVGERELIGSTSTISLGGLSFNIDEALEKGGLITMQISSPDGHEKIEVQGQIVWSEKDKTYGVKFAEAKMGTLAMLQQWMQGLAKV